jgi:hypothetical protein
MPLNKERVKIIAMYIGLMPRAVLCQVLDSIRRVTNIANVPKMRHAK